MTAQHSSPPTDDREYLEIFDPFWAVIVDAGTIREAWEYIQRFRGEFQRIPNQSLEDQGKFLFTWTTAMCSDINVLRGDLEKWVEMKITALAPWFGSNRMLAKHAGECLRDCVWVGIPFAGGMSEIPHMKARTILANDLHQHVINLADVVASGIHGPKLKQRLENLLFHPEVLRRSQALCLAKEAGEHCLPIDWAEAYFVCCWQGRSSKSGTRGEFNNQLAIRWEAGGGDSAKRYHSAVESLDQWRQEFQRVTFSCLDVFEFIKKCKDRDGHGIYVDSPFPCTGDKYTHSMTEEEHVRLARVLSEYTKTKVVCRFYDHSLVRDLYPTTSWIWRDLEGRNQANDGVLEYLITNKMDSCATPKKT